MPRKQDGFVPLGDVAEAVTLPGDRALTHRDAAAPAARRGFTRLDQATQLVHAREADPELGFMARLLALCTLPRTNPGNRLQYIRRNGPYTLSMTATGRTAKLPFGHLPRLLLAWVTTEAVRTQRRELVLGNSLSEFMRKLGIYSTDGKAHKRLRNQMERLFKAALVLEYDGPGETARVGSLVTDKMQLWWDERKPDAPVLWESTIELGEKFFEELIRHPVPLDLHVLRAVKRSSLGLDLYLWLVYRTFALKGSMRLSWKALYRQFGADPAKATDPRTVDAFRTDCLRELGKIKTAWPGLQYRTDQGVLVLAPSLPCIPPRHQLS